MVYIRVETITSENKREVSNVETQNPYVINFPSGQKVELLDRMCQICTWGNLVIVETEDRDLRGGFKPGIPWQKDDRRENNVLAFDIQGNFLWNIGSIIGDIKLAVDNISCVLKSEIEGNFDVESNVLLRCVAAGWTFIVDAENRKLLAKIPGLVK